jgi:hypothetical protein
MSRSRKRAGAAPEASTDTPQADAAPILITGMHRTGTSMVAKALHLAGLYLGREPDLIEAAPDNPSGFYEHAAFVRLDDDLLAATGGAWDHPPQAPPLAVDDPRVEQFAERARQLVSELGIVPHWGWKDPRASLTIRFWLDLVSDLRVILCVRHPLEVALSLKRRNNTSYAHGLSLWHTYYETVLGEVPADRLLVSQYDAILRDRAAELARLLAFANLSAADDADPGAALDRGLRHHTLDVDLAEAGLDARTIELYGRLLDWSGAASPPPEGNRRPAPARVDRETIDLLALRETLADRTHELSATQRERDKLRERAAAMEELGKGQVLDKLLRRINRLEDTTYEIRYEVQAASSRADAGSLRGCRELVRSRVPRRAQVLVIAKSDPAWLDLYGRRTANFPQDETGRYPGFAFSDGVGAIAHLEAQRHRGADFLLIPAQADWWRERYPEFAAHLAARYEIVADEDGVGFVADLRGRRAAGETDSRSLPQVVDWIAGRLGGDPAILDCTGGDAVAHLPGRKVFTPPGEHPLPYRDRTVELVVVPAPGDGEPAVADALIAECRRVASTALIFVRDGGAPTVSSIEDIGLGAEADPQRISFVPLDPGADRVWLKRLEQELADEPGTELVPEPETLTRLVQDGGLLSLVETGVLPLPGCCDAVRATFARDPQVGAAAVKLLTAHGTLEAAGTVVFEDGSEAAIARGSTSLAAAEHEYLRDVCGGAGLTFFSAAAVAALPGEAVPPGSLTAAAGHVWSAGQRVAYQPDAAAVRLTRPPPAADDARARLIEAWSPALAQRPERPATESPEFWRSLLAGDRVADSWLAESPA